MPDQQPSSGATPDYLAPYSEMVERVGPAFEALLWTSEHTQAARFRAMDEMLDLTGRVIVDAGCGRGDFVRWMSRREIAYGAYIGLDAIEELLEVGRAMNLPESLFLKRDFVADARAFRDLPRDPEVVVFSGSLNTLRQPEAEAALEQAWEACTEALVFNFLSDRAPREWQSRETGPARRFDTLGLIRWAFDRTPMVSVRHDYLAGNDATILMRKEPPRLRV